MDSGLKRFLQIKCNANDVSIQEQEFVLLGDQEMTSVGTKLVFVLVNKK